MLTTDHFFLLYFFPFFLLLYYLLKRRIYLANIVIIIFSILFYSSFGKEYLPVLLVPLVLDFFLAHLIFKEKHSTRKKLYLLIGILLNLGLLIYFKYKVFLGENLAYFFSNSSLISNLKDSVIVPVGISFITFQRISYLVDIYRKKLRPSNSIITYATYDLLFPHILAGPILRFSNIKDQIVKRLHNKEVIFTGTKYFAIGVFFKIVIADQLFTVEEFLTAQLSTITLDKSIILMLYFTMRIYFDFLGYSLMAIGIAKCIGFDFPHNFNAPYQSKSITDFWRRWNITLSSWLRDYLYIPLGGNRKGNIRTYINLFLTMFLAGLWHGSSWSFALWGSLHGFYLIAERFFMKKGFRFPFPTVVKVIITFSIVFLTWIPFKFSKTTDLITFFQSVTRIDHLSFSQQALNIIIPSLPAFLFALVWSFFLKEEQIENLKPSWRVSIVLAVIFIASVGFSLIRRTVPFIYFQF